MKARHLIPGVFLVLCLIVLSFAVPVNHLSMLATHKGVGLVADGDAGPGPIRVLPPSPKLNQTLLADGDAGPGPIRALPRSPKLNQSI